ncbi:MAG: 4-alpha-glucanotransferase [Marinagarivorans sp.]
MEHFDKLFYWHGIADSYYNYRGDLVTVPFENKLNIINAMGVDTSDPEKTAQNAYQLDVAPWQQWLLDFAVSYQGAEQVFFLQVAPNELALSFDYQLMQGDVCLAAGTLVPQDFAEVGDYAFEGVRYSRRAISVPNLPLGYHSLSVSCGGETQTACYAVAPSKAYVSPALQNGERVLGIIVQLYTLTSSRNWGIGDFTDLAFLIRKSAALGVQMIGLNPLHALLEPVADNCSPYSPSDRRFNNPLYIDPEQESDFRLDIKNFAQELELLRKASNVPYGPLAKLKYACFRQMFEVFCQVELGSNSPRDQAFQLFVETQGAALEDFCIYQVAQELNLAAPWDDEEAKAAFIAEHRQKAQFHAYLQWLADKQLAACQQLATSLGMGLGLMRDLAVGANGSGSEVSSHLDLFCREAAVGAPPDPLAEQGQNWGLPPMDPASLRLSRFSHFITLLRTNMAHCGALRIDHAMSLLRLWWCPPGTTADHGAYVYYPFHELMALLKLESHLNRCMVIGEDMGVVPPELRQALYDGDIFTNKLFYFEKDPQGQFKHPDHYEPHSLAMVTNHDVPTLAAWWNGQDLLLRQALKLYPPEVNLGDLQAGRRYEKSQLLNWLIFLGFSLPGDFEAVLDGPLSWDLCALILKGANRCRSQLFVVQLEDLELLDTPVNVPGTCFEYPNWQRKLAKPLEAVFADAQVGQLLRDLVATRAAS